MKAIVGNHERYIRNSLRSDNLVSRNSFRSDNNHQHHNQSHNASPSYSSGNESGGLQRRFTFKKEVSFRLVIAEVSGLLLRDVLIDENNYL